MKTQADYLALYSEDCLRCSHLVEGAEKSFAKCHFTKGNKMCPASEVKIVIVGKIEDYAARLKEARQKKDAKAEAKVWALVSKESVPFQHRMYQLIGEL